MSAPARPFCQRLSRRPSTNGIHPIWLSENAILMFGNRTIAPDISQSTNDICELIVVPAWLATRGASGELWKNFDADPMWMQTTVPVSLHAARNGSQYPSAS